MMTFSPSFATADPNTRYIVIFNNKVPDDASQTIEKAGGKLVKTFPHVGIGIAVSSSLNFQSSLKSTLDVYSVGKERFQTVPIKTSYKYIESMPTPTDFLYPLQWNIRRVRADLAWPITSGSHNTVVAVIDTGIAWNHPDLEQNVLYHSCFSSTGDCSEYPEDPCLGFHGTNVAGIIAASFGGGGIIGVGPNLGLASYNVFEDSGQFDPYVCPYGNIFISYDSSIWDAMLDATDKGFKVINISLGGYVVKSASKQDLANALDAEDIAAWTAWKRIAEYVTRHGATIVASAGNEDIDLNGPVDHIPSDLPSVISVGATGIRPNPAYPQSGAYDVRAFYSNFGAAVTLCAPGGDFGLDYGFDPGNLPENWLQYLIWTTDVYPDPTCALTASCFVSYTPNLGTSFSSPHVAGVAGLVIDHNPSLNSHQVVDILKRTAENLGNRQQFGHGMVDAYRAVGSK